MPDDRFLDDGSRSDEDSPPYPYYEGELGPLTSIGEAFYESDYDFPPELREAIRTAITELGDLLKLDEQGMAAVAGLACRLSTLGQEVQDDEGESVVESEMNAANQEIDKDQLFEQLKVGQGIFSFIDFWERSGGHGIKERVNGTGFSSTQIDPISRSGQLDHVGRNWAHPFEEQFGNLWRGSPQPRVMKMEQDGVHIYLTHFHRTDKGAPTSRPQVFFWTVIRETENSGAVINAIDDDPSLLVEAFSTLYPDHADKLGERMTAENPTMLELDVDQATSKDWYAIERRTHRPKALGWFAPRAK